MQLLVRIKTVLHVTEMASILSCGGDTMMFIGLYLGPSLTVFKEVTFFEPTHTSRKFCPPAVTLKTG
jgi:hypothetical protein